MEIFKKLKKISNFCIITTSSFLNKGMEDVYSKYEPKIDELGEDIFSDYKTDIDELVEHIIGIARCKIENGANEELHLSEQYITKHYDNIEFKCKIDRKFYPFKMFGRIFVEKNKDNMLIEYNGVYYTLKEYFMRRIVDDYNEFFIKNSDDFTFKLHYKKDYSINGCGMFSDCISYKKMSFNFSGENPFINMEYMFAGCVNLENVPQINIDIINIKSIRGMFINCFKLEGIDQKIYGEIYGEAYKNVCMDLKKIYIDDSCSIYHAIDKEIYQQMNKELYSGYCKNEYKKRYMRKYEEIYKDEYKKIVEEEYEEKLKQEIFNETKFNKLYEEDLKNINDCIDKKNLREEISNYLKGRKYKNRYLNYLEVYKYETKFLNYLRGYRYIDALYNFFKENEFKDILKKCIKKKFEKKFTEELYKIYKNDYKNNFVINEKARNEYIQLRFQEIYGNIAKFITKDTVDISYLFAKYSNFYPFDDEKKKLLEKDFLNDEDYIKFEYFNSDDSITIYTIPDLSECNFGGLICAKGVFMNNVFLEFLPDLTNWKSANDIEDISFLFARCARLVILPDISEWNVGWVSNISGMFLNCEYIQHMPDLSKWNTENVTLMEYLFFNCFNLKSLPDMSKWKVSDVTSMKGIFGNCKLLKTVWKDKLSWNTKNLVDISRMFYGCASLESLPDISNWDVSSVKTMKSFCENCELLKTVWEGRLSWNTESLVDISRMFYGCANLKKAPDMSKFNTSKVKTMNNMFSCCVNLEDASGLSGFIINNVKDMRGLFCNCRNLVILPDISKWIYVLHMDWTNLSVELGNITTYELKTKFEGCLGSFAYCKKLEEIYNNQMVNIRIANIENTNMVANKSKEQGQEETFYDSKLKLEKQCFNESSEVDELSYIENRKKYYFQAYIISLFKYRFVPDNNDTNFIFSHSILGDI